MKNCYSAETLRSLLSYDQDTGELRWKPRPEAMFRLPQSCRSWNTRYAGKLATFPRKTYLQVKLTAGSIAATRLIWILMTGEEAGLFDIDHINGVKDDNRWGNLRLATRGQNSRNSKVRRDGLKGAYFSKRHKKWQSVICKDRKLFHLGYFETEAAAHSAYCEAASVKHGVFARTA